MISWHVVKDGWGEDGNGPVLTHDFASYRIKLSGHRRRSGNSRPRYRFHLELIDLLGGGQGADWGTYRTPDEAKKKAWEMKQAVLGELR